jgi:hypothetical protein
MSDMSVHIFPVKSETLSSSDQATPKSAAGRTLPMTSSAVLALLTVYLW